MEFTVTKEVVRLKLIKSPKTSKKPLEDIVKKVKKTTEKKGLEKKIKKVPKKIELKPVKDAYARHTENYRKFHSEYIKSMASTGEYKSYTAESTSKVVSWVEEAISYKERKELVRTIQMNALMGGAHNPVDTSLKEAYEHWKMCSKFNELMSFMMYDLVISPC